MCVLLLSGCLNHSLYTSDIYYPRFHQSSLVKSLSLLFPEANIHEWSKAIVLCDCSAAGSLPEKVFKQFAAFVAFWGSLEHVQFHGSWGQNWHSIFRYCNWRLTDKVTQVIFCGGMKKGFKWFLHRTYWDECWLNLDSFVITFLSTMRKWSAY